MWAMSEDAKFSYGEGGGTVMCTVFTGTADVHQGR